jgi:dolichyl-phosphate-mannose-protein mannosyltransferase
MELAVTGIIVTGVIAASAAYALRALPAFQKSSDTLVFEPRNCPDALGLAVLILIYGTAVFHRLGSSESPRTFWKPYDKGQMALADFGTVRNLERTLCLVGIGEGEYELKFSLDGNTWTAPLKIVQNAYDLIGWREIQTRMHARFVHVVSIRPGLELSEIGFVDANGSVLPVRGHAQYPPPEPGIDSDDAANLFDEQAMVPRHPSYFNGMFFDETYFARAGCEIARGIASTETTHPPLGKILISLGVRLFGFNPLGWRIMPAVFGIAMVPLVYAMALSLFAKPRYALWAAILFSCDLMHLALSRMANIDVFAVFFVVLTYWLSFLYFRSRGSFSAKAKLTLIVAAGASFGFGAACKWNAAFAGAGAMIVLVYSIVRDCVSPKSGRIFLGQISMFSAVLLITPILAYLLSYAPVFSSADWVNLLSVQKQMYSYHSALTASHPFSSTWYQWPIMYKPVWAYMGEDVPADKISSIVLMGNAAIWWPAAPAAIAMLVFAIRRREFVPFFLSIGFACAYLPWIIVPRKLLFIYHFWAAVPFAVFAITYIWIRVSEKLSRFIPYAWLACAVALFIMFYPIATGMTVERSYATHWLRWFNSWYIYR